MKPQFSLSTSSNIATGKLLYDLPDYSFRYEYTYPDRHSQRCWLVFGKVEIAVDISTGVLLGCSCYNYWKSWGICSLQAPSEIIKCNVRIEKK